jgi:hypothetical protein
MQLAPDTACRPCAALRSVHRPCTGQNRSGGACCAQAYRPQRFRRRPGTGRCTPPTRGWPPARATPAEWMRWYHNTTRRSTRCNKAQRALTAAGLEVAAAATANVPTRKRYVAVMPMRYHAVVDADRDGLCRRIISRQVGLQTWPCMGRPGFSVPRGKFRLRYRMSPTVNGT